MHDLPIRLPSPYDVFAELSDDWYEGHYKADEPARTIERICTSILGIDCGHLQSKVILDCACGAGNSYIPFKKMGYTVFGTDGSREMLLRGKQNCQSEGVATDGLVLVPIDWTDRAGYRRHLGSRRFDIMVNTTNSFCHLPPTDEHMQIALENFSELLKPGGLLIIDTKRYVQSVLLGDRQTYKELRFDAKIGEWAERTERQEVQTVPGRGLVYFHTRLLYDVDPAFRSAVQRALIVLTIFGQNVPLRTMVLPYYPLPARILQDRMERAGFRTSVISANTDEAEKWRYDVVVGRKVE